MRYIRGFRTSVDRYFFSEDDNDDDEDFYLLVDVANTSGVEHIYYFDNFDIFRFWCNINKDIIGIIDNYEFDEVYYLCTVEYDLHVKALSLLKDYYQEISLTTNEKLVSYFYDLAVTNRENYSEAGYLPFYYNTKFITWADSHNRTLCTTPLTVIDLLLKNPNYIMKDGNEIYVYKDSQSLLVYTIRDVEKFDKLVAKFNLIRI